MRLHAWIPPRGRTLTRLVRRKIVAMVLIWPFIIGALITVLPVLSTTQAWAAPKEPARNAKRLDINSASTDELKSRLKIRQADARQIVKGRPYRSTDQLVKKKIISKATYEKIKNEIMANVKGQRSRSKDELVRKSVDSTTTYERIKNPIIANR